MNTANHEVIKNFSINYELYRSVCEHRIVNGITPRFRILQSFDPTTGNYTLSDTPTASGTFIYPTVTISMFPTISKMIWYRVSKMSMDDASVKSVQSESYGPVSITYSEKEINAQYNYPQILIDDLGIAFAKVG